jgi:putative Mg2+ transporter-C (MgtC) family protein
MEHEWLNVFTHLFAATMAGGLIGLERSYHGRPAGFRTHALVCTASSLLMLVTMYQGVWFASAAEGTVRIDPTRMAQGVMTGIGFLGAGVIMREGLTVRGLTTAASIWITAAIGILAGIGFYSAVVMASLITLGVLSVFRAIENRMPAQVFANHTLLFERNNTLSELQVKELLSANGFSVTNISYRLQEKGEKVEYRMTVRTMDRGNIEKLSRSLLGLSEIVEFNISLTGD